MQRLTDRRLVVTGRDATCKEIVEVVHEALIQRWGQLRTWMDADRAFRTWQEGLRVALHQWQASEQDHGALLRGVPLAQAENWLAERGTELSATEREFIQAGVALRESRQARREQRRRRTLLALAGGLVIAVGLVIMALGARASAQREAAVNHSLVLAASAQQAHEKGETDLALALALEAVDMDRPPPEARRTLSAIALGPGTRATLEGHNHTVKSVAIGPDGRTALSASCAELGSDGACSHGELILWNMSTGVETGVDPRRFEGHTGWVNSVAFGPNGETAPSGSGDGTLILWDVATGQPICRFEGHAGGVNGVAFSPDGRTALSGADDTTLIVWDVSTGKAIRHFQGHAGGVTTVAFSPDGQTVLSGADDSTLILWDVVTGEELHRFEGHFGEVRDAVFNLDGRTVLSTGDHTLRLWDVETGEEIHQQHFGSTPTWLLVSPDGRIVLVGGQGPDLRLWDIERWQEVQTLGAARQAEYVEAESAAISPDGLLALSGAEDGSMWLWNLEGQAGVRRLETDGIPLSAVAVSPEGRRIHTGDMTGQAVLWDVERSEAIRRLEDDGVSVVPNAVAFSPDGESALVGCGDSFGGTGAKSLVLWDLESGQEVRRFEGHRSILRRGLEPRRSYGPQRLSGKRRRRLDSLGRGDRRTDPLLRYGR